MTDSNLVRLSYVEETQWGVTPATPAMKLLRYTGEDLNYQIETTESEEIITDRQVTDLIQTNARVTGGYRFELSFREHDEIIAAALFNTWQSLPERDNAGTADSVVTGVDDATDTYTVASGGADFIAGMLVQASGFTNPANNRVFEVASSTATTVVAAGTPTLTNETAPPGTARLKAVGFVGASGDITASATGLASTVLDFTTLGIGIGQVIKIGGNATADKFATGALNDWARVTAVTAHALTLDHLPTGWGTDAGTGKTIKVWVPDTLKNGATRRSFTFEKGFLGQTVPTYLPMAGLVPNNLSLNITPGAVVGGAITMLGKSVVAATTTSLDASPTASYGGEVINAVANVARIAEGGNTVTGPSWVLGVTLESTNNLREQTAVGNMGLVGVGTGQFRVTGTLSVYFEDATIYNKLVNNTATSLMVVFEKNATAYTLQLPKIKLSGGTPAAGGINQDVPLEAEFTALKDTVLTNKTMLIGRLDYYEES